MKLKMIYFCDSIYTHSRITAEASISKVKAISHFLALVYISIDFRQSSKH